MEEIDMEALEKEFDAICDGKTLDDKAVEEKEEEIAEEKEAEEAEETEEETEETEEESEEESEEKEEEAEEEEKEEESEPEPEVDPAAERMAELLAAKELEDAEDAALADEIESQVNYADLSKDDQLFDLNDLPDIDVGSGDKATNLKELVTEFPAVMEAINIMVGSAVKKSGEQSTQSLKKDVAQLRFKEEMESIAPGTYKTVTSSEFKTWVGNQSEGMKMLAASGDRSDSKLVLDAYEKTLEKPAEKKKAEPKEKKASKKAGMDKLLGSNLKSKTAPKEKEDKDNPSLDDLEKEWETITNAKG